MDRGDPRHDSVDQLKRGNLVVVAARPALVVQPDVFNEAHASVTLIPVTSTLVDAPLFRLKVAPSPGNGLRALSQIMIDKVTTVARARIGKTIGHVEDDLLLQVNRAMALWVGIAA